MALELRQQLKLAQKLMMTQQLRQAIRLLQLNRLELSSALQAELEQNPALEEDFDIQEEPANPQSLSAVAEPAAMGPEPDFTEPIRTTDTLPETNWEDYANNFDDFSGDNFSFAHETPAADAPSQFDFISQKPGLSAYLHWQLAHSDLDSLDWDVALYIIGNLNRYGFLEVDLPEIMQETGCDRDTAEYILELIQDLDPPGIAARNVGESLFLQLERKGMGDSLAAKIVLHHLNLLETSNYPALTRATGCKRAEVEKAVAFITAELTPYPGLPFTQENTSYIVPDIYVMKIDGEYVVRLNDDDLPHLKLSSHYQELLKGNGGLEKQSAAYIREKLKDAEWFLKSLHQRQRTIMKVMESILRFQHDFFEYGPTRLKPLILRDVAEDIGMHESTVSRVTSNKYVHTPQGLFELKYFFSTSIPRGDGEDPMAAQSIREEIRRLIRDEDPRKPLSDDAISKKLAATNIQIARRTIAKYREQMQIPPVKHRRKN